MKSYEHKYQLKKKNKNNNTGLAFKTSKQTKI